MISICHSSASGSGTVTVKGRATASATAFMDALTRSPSSLTLMRAFTAACIRAETNTRIVAAVSAGIIICSSSIQGAGGIPYNSDRRFSARDGCAGKRHSTNSIILGQMLQTLPAGLLAICAAQIGGHFLAYAVWLRHTGRLATEKAILKYHLFSACALTIIAVSCIAILPGDEVIAIAVGVVFAHGIYSLTFLELWTLSQISYTRDMLLKARDAELNAGATEDLARIGDRKRIERLEALSRTGLIRREHGRWAHGPLGRLFARFLVLVLWLPDLRSRG